jgi:hypothetical protein
MTTTKQPTWELLAEIGDINPVEYGGMFLFKDTTNVYDPEIENIVVDVVKVVNDEEQYQYSVYRTPITKCSYENGVLSDNKYHPDHEVWFAKDLSMVADYADTTAAKLISDLCSDTLTARAMAYALIGDYYGWHELDHYPLTSADRDEIEARVKQHRAKRKK